MKPTRRGRVSSLLRDEISSILTRELKDPRIGFVSVLQVEPTDDIKEAVVRVSIFGTEAEQRTTLRGLEAARPFIQALLAERVKLRHVPVLRFLLDESIRKGMEMEELIRRARAEDEQAAETRVRRHVEGDGGAGATP
ncbi:MAG: 30S ribosome-binding factor RbfA [Planctomycetes bacterium]|nr:30S ribosome-binding factor RbfA [Planctomycetota bacterium]